jgi:hypothetical protein
MAGQLKVNGVTLATEESGTVTLEAPQIKDSSNNVILDQSGTNPVLKNVEVVNNSSMMFRNRIINGAMQINQRGSTAVSAGTDNVYSVDRFNVGTAGGTATYTLNNAAEVPSGSGFAKSFHLDVSTADVSMDTSDGYYLRYKFEGQDLQFLCKGTSNTKNVTLSFWVKSPKAGIHIVELFDSDNTRHISKSYNVAVANTWQKVSLNFTGDTTGAFDNDNQLSLIINWWLAAGTNFTSGTLNTSWNAYTAANRAVGQVNIMDSTSNNFYITGVQLEEGTVATQFEHRPIGTELALCQRYFQSVQMNGIFLHPYHTTHALVNCPLFVPLRKASSVSISKTARVLRLTTQGVLDYWIDSTGGAQFSGSGDWGANLYIDSPSNRDDTLSHLGLRFNKSGSTNFPDQEPIQITGVVNSTNDGLDSNGGYFDIECEL